MTVMIDMSNGLIAEAMERLLSESGYVVVKRDDDVDEGIQPDIVVVDNGSESDDLTSRYPAARILLLDITMDKPAIMAKLLSGRIHGVLSGEAGFPAFKRAVNSLKRGRTWVDASLILRRKSQKVTVSKREREIISYVSVGLRNSEIAARLLLSQHTVKAHLNRIFRKLNISNRAQLVGLAVRDKAILKG